MGGDLLNRLEEALTDLYVWYRTNQSMERNVHRDRHLLSELNDLMRENADSRLDAAATAYSGLISDGAGATSAVRPLVRLALEFGTWAQLADQGLADAEIAKLLRQPIACAATMRPR